MKLNKAYTYPLATFAVLGIIGFSLITTVHNLGFRVNPPQPRVELEEGIKSYIIWEEDGVWKCSTKGLYVLSKSFAPDHTDGLLSEVLKESSANQLLLLIRTDVGKEKAVSLLHTLSAFEINRVYVASPYDNTLSNLKRVEPRFLYAASLKAWVKWSFFSSIHLETIYDSEADFLFIDETVRGILSPKLKAEIQRRNMSVIQTTQESDSIQY
ncbi:MAG: hypothetical protein ACRBBP_00315 [Bdellovibrionales bacterium]